MYLKQSINSYVNFFRQSLSADSLNGYDDNLDLDDEEDEIEIKLKHVKLPLLNNSNIDLLSPHWEDKSQNKSTDEISHHVDDLLENISKTLENASKLGTTSLDVMPTLPNEELIEDVSELSLKEDDDSATYVIEDKRPTIKNLTDTYNTKVAELPEDISNVSKISQPSLVSDVATSNESDCNAKNSEKSISQNLHTKTPSIGSWCSNDTLFNVEENFDDVCYDFTPNSDPSKNSTLTQNHAENDDDSVSETTPKAYDVLENCANTFIKENGIHEVPQVETMVGHTENILHNISSPLNGQEDLLGSDNDDTKQSPSIYSSANAKSPSLSFEKYPLPELPLDSKSTDSPTVLHTARSSRTSDNETDLSSMCCSDTYQTAVTDKSESTLMFTCLEQLPRSIESSENELTTPTENKINFAHISSDMPVNLTECTELSPRNEKMSTNNHNNSIFYNVAFEHLEEDKVSTPVENHYMHDLTNDSLDLAGNLIDEHFKFLNSLDSPCTTGDSLLIDNSNKSNENINGKNFPSKHSDEENIVKSFLQNEINESNKSSDFHTEKSSLFSNSMPSSTSDNSDPKEIVNKKLHFSDCDEQQSENSFVPETGKLNIDHMNCVKLYLLIYFFFQKNLEIF